jgi:RsiW-degrading membrane proteinase PrsW (M82 family)|tara:strand:+ start:124 stop:795 length:672 start_codon:yes stop_codon:yes gene_type:complete
VNLTLLLTIGVPIAIVMYIVRSDKFPEPTSLIIKTFFIGILLCWPAGFLNSFIFVLEDLLGFTDMSFLAGFTEEPLKFLAFMLFIKANIEFDEPMDAIVYGTIISLGFATYENIEYVYLYNEEFSSFYIAILRAISAIPLHACCGVIMGYYIGLYTFKGSYKYIVQALLIPILIHALYNFLTGYSGILFFGYLFLVIYFAKSLHNQFVIEQQFKSYERETKLN